MIASVELLEHARRAEGRAIETILRGVALGSLAVALSPAFVRARAAKRPN